MKAKSPAIATHRRSSPQGDATDGLLERDFRRIRDKVKAQGLAAIDKRSSAARSVLRWRRALVQDLGGVGGLTTAALTMIDLASRTRLLVDHVDAFLLGQVSLIRKKDKRVLPIVLERTKLVDSLSRQLTALGLERKAKVIPALHAYVAERYPRSGKGAEPLDLATPPSTRTD